MSKMNPASRVPADRLVAADAFLRRVLEEEENEEEQGEDDEEGEEEEYEGEGYSE